MTTLAARPTVPSKPRPRRQSPRAIARPVASVPDEGHVTLHDIPWEGYVAFLDAVGERPIRVNYDDGVMEIMTISSEHETAKKRIGGPVEDLAIELGIEIAPRGSMTFRSKRIRKGLEPDECYYIANERKIRARKQIDLRRDPPPDLVIEIDISYHEVDRESMYAEIGVPELWRYDGKQLWFFRVVAGQWVGVDGSASFPGVRPADLLRFLRMVPRRGEMSMRRAFREWVRGAFPGGKRTGGA
jgi:Uma2 family endonuclease